MVAKGQKSPGLGWYSFMGADDQESALGQPVDHVMKGRRLYLLHIPATQLMHMPTKALFHTLSDLPVAYPGKAEVIKELTKLVIIHKVGVSKPSQWL
jgi:hypothetical protein